MSAKEWRQRRQAATDDFIDGARAELDDKQKKRQAAMDDEKAGKITREERQARMRLIGMASDLRLTEINDRRKNRIRDIDAEIRERREQARRQVEDAIEKARPILENGFPKEVEDERIAKAKVRRRLRRLAHPEVFDP